MVAEEEALLCNRPARLNVAFFKCSEGKKEETSPSTQQQQRLSFFGDVLQLKKLCLSHGASA
jgi:hypothetical protein